MKENRGPKRAAELCLAALEADHISERYGFEGCIRAAREIADRNGWAVDSMELDLLLVWRKPSP